MLVARITLAVASLMFAVLGVVFLAWPESTAVKLGIKPLSPSGLTEIRATYGGLEIGLAGFFLYCAIFTPATALGIGALMAVFGGFAAGRIAGMLAGGAADALQLKILGVEIVGTILAGILLYLLRSPR